MDARERSNDSISLADGRIVGIGASAGGLESLEQFFAALPINTGMAFIVVQHLSPDFRSLMDELIARHSEMPVTIATNGMPVQANRIYLMPPGKEMIIRDRHLVLTDKEPGAFSLPIDAFFRSLALDVGAKAVAIVLSGSGSDGSRGILDVHRAGGLVLAESAASAKFDGMPLSAAASGIVEHIQTPNDLARLLCGLSPLEVAAEASAMSEDPALDAVLRLLRDNFGIDFSLYKMTTVGRRIQRRVDLLHIQSLEDYVEHLVADPDELNKLYQDLLIGVTQFFRDPECFAFLEAEVIPKLLDSVRPDEELRVWVAGCATGEEPYSLAMLLWEEFTRRSRPLRLKILATDVHQKSLDYASAGLYGEHQLAHVSPTRLERFFTRRSSGYQVSQDLRQLIVFARHNVTKDAPFTKMHFISCRNLLIYFQPQAQRTVLSLFHFGLTTGGTLLLGASESPGSLSDEFTTIDDHWKVYRKRRDVPLLTQVRLPILPTARRPVPPLDSPSTRGPDPFILSTYDQLLDEFMPPGFLVGEDRILIDSFAGAEKLLRLRRRRPSTNILELLDDDLRTVVAGAIQRAFKTPEPVSYSGIRIVTNDGPRICTLVAKQLFHPRTGSRQVLLTFRDLTNEAQAAAPRPEASQPIPVAEASRDRLMTLETELGHTRETLQATIEELETSNEEMQATNEELVASNEELQSTNEELHSVNEELYSVNAEYQQKIAELKELNTDMAHLLEGTDVGTVFLDKQLRIRRFTSRIASVFRFQPHDVGRQIRDFSHNIERPQLMEEIEAAHQRGLVIEDEVRDSSGTPYFLRILPYRASGTTASQDALPIEGVVLTLTDITALDKARSRVAQLSAIVESSDDAIIGQTLEGIITSWNRGATTLFGYSADEAIGNSVELLMAPGTEAELADYLERVKQGSKVEHVSTLCMHKNGTRRDVLITFSPIVNEDAIAGASAMARDISKIAEMQRALEEEKQKVQGLLEESVEQTRSRERFLAMLSHELRNPLAAVLNATTVIKQSRDPSAALRGTNVVERQAKHMKRLLDDLLDVSRITSNKFAIARAPIELRDSIETAVEATAPLFQSRNIELETKMPPHRMPMHADGNRLTQVVANLLANAATYSPEGSKVCLEVELDGGVAVVRVVDCGDGIDAALKPKIFDLFVQSEQKLDRQRGGLGVGLSLAKAIVDLHSGSIDLESDGPGKGTTFIVRLPLGTNAGERTWLDGLHTGPCRIVLVDDQPDALEMLKALFEERQHVVFDATDGPTAIQLIEQHRPDVAFIDIGLPKMNGFEVAQHIRSRPELRDVLLVALTGYGGHTDVHAARAAGFDEHVTKPAEFKRLEQILARRRPVLD
ncbi:MAG: CheR family methyltransferase [Kofleriaceae bacterium]